MLRKVALSLALVGLLAAPTAARADGPTPGPTSPPTTQLSYMYSNMGPGAGHGTISMGGRIYLILPTFDFGYKYGILDNLDFELHLSTLGILNMLETGVQARLLGDSGFSLGVRGDLAIQAVFLAVGDGAAGGVGFGLVPGLIASFGGESFQLTVAADFPLSLAGAASVSGGGSAASSGFGATLRPSVTAEFGVGVETTMYIQVQALVALSGGSGVFAPIIALGASW